MTLRQRARTAHLNGHTTLAKELYRRLLDEDSECIPEDVGNLASLLTSEEQIDEAIFLYEKYLIKWPNNFQLLFNGANSYIKIGSLEKAINLLSIAIKIKPKELNLIITLSKLLIKTNNNQKAIDLLENFCRENPNEGLAWLELGVNYCRYQLTDKALEAFNYGSKALPEHCGLIANRLTLLKDLNQIDKATDVYHSLTQEKKNNIHIRGAWAGLLIKTEATDEAIKILEELSKLEPHISGHWINLAACKKASKHNLSCQRILKKGLTFNPNDETLKQFLAQSFAESGEIKKALQLLNLERKDWDKVPDEHIFNVQFIGAASTLIDPQVLCNIARVWEGAISQKSIGPLWKDTIRESVNQRKIKIAYLSSDFANHPVSRFLLPILKTHDKNFVEIFGLNCGLKYDGISELIASQCSHWLNLSQINDIELARVISDLQIDAVIELGGYTGGSRLRALINKPAPIQFSYLGYFAPTYLNCIDGWIGDEELFGGLSSKDKEENLIHIEGGYMSFEPIRLPKIEKEESEYIRFGSFNNSRKLNYECIELFTRIITNIPNSQLVIKSITFVEKNEKNRIFDLLIKAGLKESQFIILDWIEGTKAHMELYKYMDIALDPFPYGGATTTAEALWMGVPVIALAGKGMVGRLSSSILKSASCQEWIAKDLEKYENIANDLAIKGKRGIKEREELRTKVRQSNLGNGRRVSSQIENIIFKQIQNNELI